MPKGKIRLEQIEGGRTLQAIIRWYEQDRETFAQRFNALRLRSRAAAEDAGLGPKQIGRLIREVRNHRVKA